MDILDMEVNMRVGIPRGLLYPLYKPFFETFFSELGAEIITSPDTNRDILNEGVKHCVDEACLPIKVFHGHVAYLRDKCDIMLIPRFMNIRRREFICPKFCGLPEMVSGSIKGLPPIIGDPIVATEESSLYKWAYTAGSRITGNKFRIRKAFRQALYNQERHKQGICDEKYPIRVALAGHPYNLYDNYINMNLVKKLNRLNIGVITEENLNDDDIDEAVKELHKRPFWTFTRNSYGFGMYMARRKLIDGIIYVSSFACGIDSVSTELLKLNLPEDIPYMVLKIDEHTGEAGFDTRIEAFADMLERRCYIENNISTYGKRIFGS